MIAMYCMKYHRLDGLCPDCEELASYAQKRLDVCPFQEDKPSCSKCPTHCYTPEMRKKIKKVMRYAGPRMIYKHPFLALRYLLDRRKGIPDKQQD